MSRDLDRIVHDGRIVRGLMIEGIEGVFDGRYHPTVGMAAGLMGATAARTMTNELRIAMDGPRQRARPSLPEPEKGE